MIARRLLMAAAKRLAENPEVRRKAGEVAETAYQTAKPKVEDAYRRTRPKVENAGRHVAESWQETKGEGEFLDDPIGFAKRFRNRLLPPEN